VNEVLMDVILDQVLFLDLTEDEHLDPDIAVKQLESITYYLRTLSNDERNTFITHVEKKLKQKKGVSRERAAGMRALVRDLQDE
jgi:hypothetical protein